MTAPPIRLKREMTAYEILSVDPSSKYRHKEIRKNYTLLIKKHHPDKGGYSSVFRAIQMAYNFIGDTAARIQYDKRSDQQKLIDMSDVIEETQKSSVRNTNKKSQSPIGYLMEKSS